jgi:hypothetical protein
MPPALVFSKHQATALALQSVPSWNLTPFRKWKVIEAFFGSVTISQDSARLGTSLPPCISFNMNCWDNCMVKTELPEVSGFQPMGVAGPEGSIHLKVPPYLGVSEAGGAVAVVGAAVVGAEVEEAIVAGLVVAAVVAAGAAVAEVVAVVVAAGLVVVGVASVPQPVIMKAQTNRTARGINSFFNITSSNISYVLYLSKYINLRRNKG